jgi:hypothetical protein
MMNLRLVFIRILLKTSLAYTHCVTVPTMIEMFRKVELKLSFRFINARISECWLVKGSNSWQIAFKCFEKYPSIIKLFHYSEFGTSNSAFGTGISAF